MELLLNSIWAILAAIAVASVLRSSGASPGGRRSRLLAIAMVVIVLFPAISISDDLWASQNPLEENAWLRRHDPTAQPHMVIPDHAPVLLSSLFEVSGLKFLGHAPLVLRATALPQAPEIAAPSIRPPPTV